MRWIESSSFIGLDRRTASKFRVIERRRIDLSVRAPSLATKVRQLRVQAFSAHAERDRLALVRQIDATASLATHLGDTLAATRLKSLAARVTTTAKEPIAGWLDEDLQVIATGVANQEAP